MSSSSSAAAASVSENSSSSCKYKGVRKRKWGKYVSEIRLPNSRERIWLGSYDTAEKAARAFDAAQFCLRGRSARFNFPDDPPEIAGARSMTPSEIQAAAARFAHADSRSESSNGAESSPCHSASAAQVDSEMTEVPLDDAFVDQFLTMGTDNNNLSDFGLYPGFDDFSGDYYVPTLPDVDYYWPDNNNNNINSNEDLLFSEASSSLWNF